MNTPHDEQHRSGKAGRRGNGRQPPREPIAITDRRRIDPVTGRVREDTPGSPSPQDRGASTLSGKASPGEKAGTSSYGAGTTRPESRPTDADRLRELTADLQRLQAEYANYRRRVERDRAAAAENAKATVVAAFLGVLDDLDWAREHGDTAREPLHSLYRKIRTILARMGVAAFGERGDRFDPTLHEAASHEGHGTDLVIDTVLRRGYTFGVHKVLRTALVTVIDRDRYENTSNPGPPADPNAPADPDSPADTDARPESGGAGDPGDDPNPYRCG
ncbi:MULTISPECIES: nucleotide exchange factor GrpE [unclassified Rhodococcus (in: high G+C Gram-positive bacteria)]|uniref:nucleotide exchange factor GrpE n=1 Tax=unclassified Rhodococcus (in: high G+C Gram-positive bacteria) TaxID=192944 RepID=UPI001639DABA|nr:MULTISPECIES: nucleotide exchange factor GrpE [unclassified Rhodococcus (in: high G+C Gram-positive bacteria)]MBC2644467.1 nucleotide exchange factor GrpE [Rhodococcus sp. 3A]MBC2897845.1 nucleotide exchange factor GrpE [Rhodococcus sp. 4CII]